MKIRMKLGIAASLGLLVAAGSSYQAKAQVGIASTTPNSFGTDGGIYLAFNPNGLVQARVPPQGTWAEIINVTPRWIVVQNEQGQQFPIASDRIRQFLIRWPISTDQLTPNSVVEVIGPSAGSNNIIADHIDVYEADAQRLVTPTDNSLFGFNRNLTAFDVDQQNTYGLVYWMSPEEYAIPNRAHVVGSALGGGVGGVPLRIAGVGQNWYTIQPSVNGMTATQVTIGNNSYARKGDIVYIVPENVSTRSLDVTQLVLYKKIALRTFQP